MAASALARLGSQSASSRSRSTFVCVQLKLRADVGGHMHPRQVKRPRHSRTVLSPPCYNVSCLAAGSGRRLLMAFVQCQCALQRGAARHRFGAFRRCCCMQFAFKVPALVATRMPHRALLDEGRSSRGSDRATFSQRPRLPT